MLTLIMLAAIGQCRSNNCHIVKDAVVVDPLVYYKPANLVEYYATYRVGEDDYQNAMIEKLTLIAEQNQQIVQNLRANNTAPDGSGMSAVETAARDVLKTNCTQCHNASNKKGEMDLTGELSMNDWLLVDEVARTGEMPPKPAQPLDDESYAKIQAKARENPKAVRALLKAGKTKPPVPAVK